MTSVKPFIFVADWTNTFHDRVVIYTDIVSWYCINTY